MTEIWKKFRRLDRYELVGAVDVLTHIELSKILGENPLVSVVKDRLKELPKEFEIIVDYKGMVRRRRVG